MSKINLNFKKPAGPRQMSRRKSDLMDAYDIGFAKGWDEIRIIPTLCETDIIGVHEIGFSTRHLSRTCGLFEIQINFTHT